ncbi:hypothetical protein G9A89_005018 [Geosiphon pyriformis]|nr:hypothetical protein G9A89_005018 [Geosiphon pyriformis]
MLIDDYGSCPDCKRQQTGYKWCRDCTSEMLKANFRKWSSKNLEIDSLIRETQKSPKSRYELMEWIPFEQFSQIREIGKGGFGMVYSATWLNGPIMFWDHETKQFLRQDETPVALKHLFKSKNNITGIVNEVTAHFHCKDSEYIPRCYGITRDPFTKDYIMVSQLANKGNLHNYLCCFNEKLDWKTRIGMLRDIAAGLAMIHEANYIHCDFHSGNILRHGNNFDDTLVADLGLCRPANHVNQSQHSGTFGVLPYVAPEVFRGGEYTKAADIYSFGILMWEITSAQKPFMEFPHDTHLAFEICDGKRPIIVEGTPPCYVSLMERCWDSNPKERPTAKQIHKIVKSWHREKTNVSEFEVAEKYRLSQNANFKLSLNPVTIQHPHAFYASRQLRYSNLPIPRNSRNFLSTPFKSNSFARNMDSHEFSLALDLVDCLKVPQSGQSLAIPITEQISSQETTKLLMKIPRKPLAINSPFNIGTLPRRRTPSPNRPGRQLSPLRKEFTIEEEESTDIIQIIEGHNPTKNQADTSILA